MHDLCAAAGIHYLQHVQNSRRAAVMFRKHLWRDCEYFQFHKLHKLQLAVLIKV